MCKDANEKEEQKIKMGDLEYNLNHFFRYVYGGFILCLIIVLMLPKQAGEIYGDLGGKDLQGNIFFIFLFVAIGTGLYTFYKSIVSEWLIDSLHFNKPGFLWGHSDGDCVFQYLVKLGVDEKHRLTAFRLIRDKDFNPMVREIFYLRHSETHVLYITSVVCFIGLLVRLIAWFLKIPYCNTAVFILILVVGIVSLAAGLFSDKRLCADERYYSKLNEDKIRETLVKAKLLEYTYNIGSF